MEKYELPENWDWRTIRSVVMPKEIWSQSKTPRKTFQYVDIFSVDNKVGIIGETKTIPGDNPPSRAKRVIRVGDVIFATTRPYLKNIAVVPERLDDQICSTGFCVLRPNLDQVTTEWLFYICRSNIVVDQVVPNQEKSAYPAVSDDEIYDSEIPVPPLSKQRRIVKRIEELTKRVEEARQLRKSTVEEVDKYIPAAIASVFGDGQNHGWVTKKISEICKKPQYGYTESACHAAVGPKFLRITDIQDGNVEWENVPYCKCEDVDKYRLKTDDIVFARTGATTGKSYLIKNPPDAIFASYLIRLCVGSSILPEFLYWHFQSSTYWASVSSEIDEGNRPNMNGTKLANIEVSYPEDKAEQHHIVEYLRSLQAKAKELKQLQAETEAELSAFTPALLSKAFRGEL